MRTTRNTVRGALAALAIGALGLGFAPAATAVATYDGFAEFELTLSSVTNTVGTPVSSGWFVDFDGYVLDEDAIFSGDADASVTTVVPGFGSMVADDTIIQSSTSEGWIINGAAASFGFTGLEIDVFNDSLEDLTFTFDYTASVATTVTTDAPGEDAFVSAFVDVLDDLGAIDILLYVEADALFGPPDDFDSVPVTTVSFILAPDEENVIAASFIDTYGFAESSAVPEPATLLLLTLGLVGIGYGRRQ